MYKQRSGENFIYLLETTTNLLTGPWTYNGYTVDGTNITGDTYDEITNTIPTDSVHSYIRLQITD